MASGYPGANRLSMSNGPTVAARPAPSGSSSSMPAAAPASQVSPVGLSASTGLPYGWEAKRDTQGRLYFVDHNRKLTHWADPRPLPPGWDSKFDPAQRRYYFIDHNTKRTAWEDPRPPIVLPGDVVPKAAPKTPLEVLRDGRTCIRHGVPVDPTQGQSGGRVDVWYDPGRNTLFVGPVGGNRQSVLEAVPVMELRAIKLGRQDPAFDERGTMTNMHFCFSLVYQPANQGLNQQRALHLEALSQDTRTAFVTGLRAINPNIQILEMPKARPRADNTSLSAAVTEFSLEAAAVASSSASSSTSSSSSSSTDSASPTSSPAAVGGARPAVDEDGKPMTRLAVYKECLRVALADQLVTPDEDRALHALRKRLDITDAENDKALVELGLSAHQFHELHKDPAAATQECVICLQSVADHVVVPCFHLCMCEDCAFVLKQQAERKPNDTHCPKCRTTVQTIHKIY